MRGIVEEAGLAFLRRLGVHDKLAVELSPQARAALGVDTPSETLDDLEAAVPASGTPAALDATADEQAQASSSHPADGDGGPPSASPLPAAELAPRAAVEDDEDPPGIESSDQPEAPSSTESTSAAPRGAFSDRRAHPMVLHELLQARYGDDWLFWEPETLWWAIRRDFGPVSELCRNKLQALRLADKSYAPWSDWDTFEKCGLAWNDATPIFGAFQPSTPAQLAFAVQILRELHPEAPLGHEAIAYEAAVLDDNGFVFAPEEWFPGAQAVLDRKVVDGGFRSAVENAWKQLASSDLIAVTWRPDDPVDIHIARLLVVRTYLSARAELRRAQLASAPPRMVPSVPT